MKKLLVILTTFALVRCTNEPLTNTNEETILFNGKIPDLMLFNSNGVLKNDTLILVKGQDTIKQYIYDSLGRLTTYKRDKLFARKEYSIYFQNTQFPIAKFINTDYSLQYFSSLVAKRDTIISYWYYGFGVIEDTSMYVFKNNKVAFMRIPALNDIESFNTNLSFSYDKENLIKIKKHFTGIEKAKYMSLDSIVVSYYYHIKVTKVRESYYFKDKINNYSNLLSLDDKGFPTSLIEKDTIEYKIFH